MQRTKIAKILKSEAPSDHVLVKGWVRTKRDAKAFSFIELNDGSCLANLQVIAEPSNLNNYDEVRKITTGAALEVEGRLVPSQGKGAVVGGSGHGAYHRRNGSGRLSTAKETPYGRISAHHRTPQTAHQ